MYSFLSSKSTGIIYVSIIKYDIFMGQMMKNKKLK